MKIHPVLAAKLVNQKVKYQKVTKFAQLLPLFSERIIEDEIDGLSYYKLSGFYGRLTCTWGINWYITTPTNYPKKEHKEVGFVNVYINTYSLFGEKLASFASQELHKAIPSISVHFYDAMNSTFYFLPDEAEEGLKKLEQWYVETKSKCDDYLREKRKIELQKELEKLG